MVKRKRVSARLVVTGVALAACLLAGSPMVEAELDPAVESAPDLLEVGRAVNADAATVDASRQVDVDVDLLQPGRARTVSMDLYASDPVVDLEPFDSGAPGWAGWSGSVRGEPDSSVTLVRRGDDVAGVVSSTDGTYRIRNVGSGRHVTEAIGGPFPEGPDTITPPPRAPGAGTAVAPEPTADPRDAGSGAPGVAADVPIHPVVDVLVGYTPAVLAAAGSVGAVNSEAALSIATTNSAYAASGVLGSVRLAGTYNVGTNLGLTTTDLLQITNPGDGVVDGIHAQRNATGADLVAVLTDSVSSCGLAWLMEQLGNADAAYGFSITAWDCAVSNYSFAHELGHNMGLNHDHYVVDEGGELFPYGFGYVNVAAGWRTVMAYNNECQAASTDCERLGRFSNPNQTYLGAPLGRPFNGTDPADSRRALNISHVSVAGYRARPEPFSSWSRFVAQHFRDFVGRAPTSAESATDTAALTNGAVTPESYVTDKLRGRYGLDHAPVARLYFAYFLRAPDRGGLDYWVNRFRNGTRLAAISSNFAGSSEFRTKYGTLTNRQFVLKVYDNVLGRTGDTGGINYWTGQLDRRVKTRGEVMIGFSESSEFKRVRAEEIDVVLLYRAMYQRGPTATEFATQVERLETGTTVARLILELLDSTTYRGRITP